MMSLENEQGSRPCSDRLTILARELLPVIEKVEAKPGDILLAKCKPDNRGHTNQFSQWLQQQILPMLPPGVALIIANNQGLNNMMLASLPVNSSDDFKLGFQYALDKLKEF